MKPLSNIIAVLAVLCACITACDETKLPTHQKVTLSGESFKLELAVTDDQIRTGMMGRESLADDEGMLFVFPDAEVRHFWMKNCLIPLDVVFLDDDGRIVSITTMPAPDPDDRTFPRYSSRWPAQFAIELAAGRADELGLREGDPIGLPYKDLKRLARSVD